MPNYYDEQQFNTVEKVTLAEDIILPNVDQSPFTVYKDIEAKFFINIMTPLLSKTELNNKVKSSPSNKGNKGEDLRISSYQSSNYIILTIPKYIVLNFTDIIPKGTEFLVASIGGDIDINKMRIIGIY